MEPLRLQEGSDDVEIARGRDFVWERGVADENVSSNRAYDGSIAILKSAEEFVHIYRRDEGDNATEHPALELQLVRKW